MRRAPRGTRGITLIELLIFIAIFSGGVIIFISILVSVTRVEVQQTAAAEVQQQSQFLLQTIQRYVEQSSVVSSTPGVNTNRLDLYMKNATATIYLEPVGGTIHLVDNGVTSTLTTNAVKVTNLTFQKYSNPPGRDSVSVVFSMETRSGSPQRKYSNSLQLGIARVSAAVFDSNVLPNTTNQWSLGVNGQVWKNINDNIFFLGKNVRIGDAAGATDQRVVVDGGVQLNPSAGRPTCDVNVRGTLWFEPIGGLATDTIAVCLRESDSDFSWRNLYP